MGHESTPQFQTFHALRIKGFAAADTVADITGRPVADVESDLAALADEGFAQFRENRGLWQLTADGRTAHAGQLASDLEGIDVRAAIGEQYEEFLTHNSEFKDLCGTWQMRDGDPNDHSDEAYDAAVVEQLVGLHDRAQPIVAAMGAEIERMSPYAPRLASALDDVRGGDTTKFTGVMCNSYHDVWMELHEDLILTQGIDRSAEGSF